MPETVHGDVTFSHFGPTAVRIRILSLAFFSVEKRALISPNIEGLFCATFVENKKIRLVGQFALPLYELYVTKTEDKLDEMTAERKAKEEEKLRLEKEKKDADEAEQKRREKEEADRIRRLKSANVDKSDLIIPSKQIIRMFNVRIIFH